MPEISRFFGIVITMYYNTNEIGTIDWPNTADFGPYMLHDWPRFAEKMAARTAAWDRVPARDD